MKRAELSKEDKEELAARGFADPHWFCKFFLPHIFPGPIPWVHWGLLSILTRRVRFLLNCPEPELLEKYFVYTTEPGNPDSPKRSIFHFTYDEEGVPVDVVAEFSRNTEVMMPRGFSKTSIAGVAVGLWKVVYAETHVMIYISETATHSETQLENIKREIQGNERIISVFGSLRPDHSAPERWTSSAFETRTGIMVAARGRGGQIRGTNIRGRRPDTIICDDVEDKDSVKTEEQRKKAREWFYGDVIPALPELNSEATITALGTLLHREALLQVLQHDPEWTCVKFGSVLEDGELLWPAMMDEEKLARKKHSFTLAGELASYYMEYFNEIRLGKESKFQSQNIIIAPPPLRSQLLIAMAMDPAISEKRSADFASIGVAGISTEGLLWVLDVWMKRGASPRELIDQFFILYERWRPERSGIESIAYQKALVSLVREEMFRPNPEGKSRPKFEVIAITHGNPREEDKATRVEGILQARYANQYVRHAQRFPLYEGQLLDWPNGKKDGPDAVAMAVKLLIDFASVAEMPDDPREDFVSNEYKPLPPDFGRLAL